MSILFSLMAAVCKLVPVFHSTDYAPLVAVAEHLFLAMALGFLHQYTACALICVGLAGCILKGLNRYNLIPVHVLLWIALLITIIFGMRDWCVHLTLMLALNGLAVMRIVHSFPENCLTFGETRHWSWLAYHEFNLALWIFFFVQIGDFVQVGAHGVLFLRNIVFYLKHILSYDAREHRTYARNMKNYKRRIRR